MLYAIQHTFKDDIDEARAAARPDHLAHLEGAGDKLKAAGPMTGKDGDDATGSMIIIEAGSYAAANLFAETDPYVKAGIVARTHIEAWNAVLGIWPKG